MANIMMAIGLLTMAASPAPTAEHEHKQGPQCERMEDGKMKCCKPGAEGKMKCEMMDHQQQGNCQMDHSQMDHAKMCRPQMDHSKMDHSQMDPSHMHKGEPSPDHQTHKPN